MVILSRGIFGIALLVACALGTHPALAQVRLATAAERTDESCLADKLAFLERTRRLIRNTIETKHGIRLAA